MTSDDHLADAAHAWVGCLACYSAGALTGRWFTASEAADVTAERIHGRPTSHEELWVFDHEGLPITSETSPGHATRLIQRLNEVDPHLRLAFHTWVLHGDAAEDYEGLPVVEDFEDAYEGRWESFEDYARDQAEESGLLHGVAESLARYFDWEAWSRDTVYDYTVLEAPDGGVYVFRSL